MPCWVNFEIQAYLKDCKENVEYLPVVTWLQLQFPIISLTPCQVLPPGLQPSRLQKLETQFLLQLKIT